MSPAAIDKLLNFAAEYGFTGFVVVVFACLLAYAWKHRGNGSGSKQAVDVTNQRVDALGNKLSENTQIIGELKNAAERNLEDHKEIKQEMKEGFERVGKRVGAVEDILLEIRTIVKEKRESVEK